MEGFLLFSELAFFVQTRHKYLYMEFILLCAVILLFVLFFNLYGRVTALEERAKLRTIEPIAPAIQVIEEMNVSVAVPERDWTVDSAEYPLSWLERLEQWAKEEWLLKLGALLILIGFGWLTSYAFLNNWIGPMGRIFIGILAGAMFLVFGWWRMRKEIHQGGIFLVLGSTTVLLTLFAARELYDFFSPSSALVVMFLSTAFVGLASVKFKNKALALASLLLASIAPLLTNSPAPDYVSLFAYLFVVILGAIWIVALTGQRALTAWALAIVTVYSFSHWNSFFVQSNQSTLLLFAYAFTAVFFLANALGLIKRGKTEDLSIDLWTAAGNGAFLLIWILVAAPEEWKSLIIALWMIIFAIGAFMIFKISARREPFYVYAGVSIALLGAATAVELSSTSLVIGYTIESVLIVLVAYALMRSVRIAERLSLLFLVPIGLSIESMRAPIWQYAVYHEHFFVLAALAVALLGLGLFFFERLQAVERRVASRATISLLIAGSVYVDILLWLSTHAAFDDKDAAVTISLVAYTLTGLAAYVIGQSHAKKALSFYGATVLGFVVVRLLFVDIWHMDLTGRIITFFAIGALLMSTAFYGRTKRVIESSDTPPRP